MSIKESALTAITAISNSDFVRAVTSAGASRRITVANLAKQIIEGYAGSSLAGSSQSVKSAIDSLNSNNGGYRAAAKFPSGVSSFTVSFDSWHTVALIIIGRNDTYNAVYLFVNGFAPIEVFATATKPITAVSPDYLTVTFSDIPASAEKHVMVISSAGKPTIAAA